MLKQEDHEDFGQMFYEFHKAFRQCDCNLNIVRLEDNHKTIQRELCDLIDGLIWALIDQDDKNFLYNTLKDFFKDAMWKKQHKIS